MTKTWLLLAYGAAAQSGSRPHGVGPDRPVDAHSFKMTNHTLSQPFDVESMERWYMSGATIPTQDHVLLAPGIKGRAGLLFHKKPVLTDNFQIEAEFKVIGNSRRFDEGFGIWYVHENVEKSYPESTLSERKWGEEGLKKMGYGLYGFKNTFDGFGVIFHNAQGTGPQVSIACNDNTKSLQATNPAHWTSKSIRFGATETNIYTIIRVQNRMVSVTVFSEDRKPAILQMNCGSVSTNGYVGFSAWSGSAEEKGNVDSVFMKHVMMSNLNLERSGEGETEYDELLHLQQDLMGSSEDRIKMTRRLTEMLHNHMIKTVPRQQELFKSIVSVRERLHTLEMGARTFQGELHALLHFDGVSNLKNHVKGLREYMESYGEHQKIVMDNLHNTIKQTPASGTSDEVRHFSSRLKAEQRSLIEKVGSTSSWMSRLMILVFFVAFVGMGFSYWRMNYYEKRHFL